MPDQKHPFGGVELPMMPERSSPAPLSCAEPARVDGADGVSTTGAGVDASAQTSSAGRA
jgi:hypothetical protein